MASTLARAEKVILAAGGTVNPHEVAIPPQSPKAPPLEQWDPGIPSRVETDHPSWTWAGGWRSETVKNDWTSWSVRRAEGTGSETTFSFTGTGVAISGTMADDGGRADVFLDGAYAGQIDAWIPPHTTDNDYWHITGLADGPHTVRIVVRQGADPRSTGTAIRLERAVVYRPGDHAR